MSHKRKVKLPEIMLFIVAAIVPVIVRVAFVAIPPELQHHYMTDVREDVFSYHKAWVLCVSAIIIILHGISDLVINPTSTRELKNKARHLFKDPVVIIMAVYILFVILSNVLSNYTHTALWGVFDRREGLFVQLAYMTVFFSTMYFVKDNRSTANLLLCGLMISSIIMGAIGFSQFINRDFFATPFAGLLVIGQWHTMAPEFDFSYGTNFNPNTFGLVTAMLSPVMFACAAVFRHKVLRGLFLIAGALMLTGIVGSRSVGGFIGGSTAVAVVVVTLLIRRLFNKKKKSDDAKTNSRQYVIIGVAVLIVGISAAGLLRGYFQENLDFTMGRIAAIFEAPDMSHLPEFEFEGRILTMSERGFTYQITFPEVPGVPMISTDGIPIEPRVAFDPENPFFAFQYIYDVPGFGIIEILRGYEFWGRDIYSYRDILMTVEPDGMLYLYHFRLEQLVDPNEPIPSLGFEGWETWGSNRGYIFARTLPLIPQFLLIGRGSDTFLLTFPAHDILSNYRYFQNPWILVDKAHNLYLQTAVTTGVVSALALIVLFGYFILTNFWALVKDKNGGADFWLRLGILASVSAFSVSSLSTDSTVSSTPMFWIIIGMGFALNGRRTD